MDEREAQFNVSQDTELSADAVTMARIQMSILKLNKDQQNKLHQWMDEIEQRKKALAFKETRARKLLSDMALWFTVNSDDYLADPNQWFIDDQLYDWEMY